MHHVSISADKLKPTQNEIYLAKTIEMATRHFAGGELNAIISKDDYILDGHHRWASTILTNPTMKLGGYMVDLNIDDLIPVLRSTGDAIGNERGQIVAASDINIFSATIQDIRDIVYEGKFVNPTKYSRPHFIAWFENIGEPELKRRLQLFHHLKPNLNVSRINMPKIRINQVAFVKNLLNRGSIDVKAPYSKK
jgi:hypothetical protein